MPELPPTSISEHFATLTDPRRDHLREHRLVDIVTIALCAVICGTDDWVAIETFGRVQHAWPRTFLAVPSGIPSHDTCGRVFARLDPDELRRCPRRHLSPHSPRWVGRLTSKAIALGHRAG